VREHQHLLQVHHQADRGAPPLPGGFPP
jgi:hypothetical protein